MFPVVVSHALGGVREFRREKVVFLTLNLGFCLIAIQHIRLSLALQNRKSNCTVVALLKDYYVQLLVEVLVTAHTK